jgi:hypothetical protein
LFSDAVTGFSHLGPNRLSINAGATFSKRCQYNSPPQYRVMLADLIKLTNS